MTEQSNNARAAAMEATAAVLRVLGHPDRLRMIELLAAREHSVAEVAGQLALAPNAASQHLSHMLAHGILARKRRGRCVYYRVVNPIAKNLVRCLRREAGEA